MLKHVMTRHKPFLNQHYHSYMKHVIQPHRVKKTTKKHNGYRGSFISAGNLTNLPFIRRGKAEAGGRKALKNETKLHEKAPSTERRKAAAAAALPVLLSLFSGLCSFNKLMVI